MKETKNTEEMEEPKKSITIKLNVNEDSIEEKYRIDYCDKDCKLDFSKLNFKQIIEIIDERLDQIDLMQYSYMDKEMDEIMDQLKKYCNLDFINKRKQLIETKKELLKLVKNGIETDTVIPVGKYAKYHVICYQDHHYNIVVSYGIKLTDDADGHMYDIIGSSSDTFVLISSYANFIRENIINTSKIDFIKILKNESNDETQKFLKEYIDTMFDTMIGKLIDQYCKKDCE